MSASQGVRLDDVTVVPGEGREPIPGATVVLDERGVVTDIIPGARADSGRYLVPAAVDLHLDNLVERRRPRASVTLDQAAVIAALDAECAAAGIGTVCIAARCEEAPTKGVVAADAVELAAVVEELAPSLACDWRVHARVEVTDDEAIGALQGVLRRSSRVALISVMEHSIERSRFGSPEEHRAFYAADWRLPLAEVDAILTSKAQGAPGRDERRELVARLAAASGIALASHDDRDPADVEAAFALGARIAEFPLTLEAARRARELGMTTVLGAPNALRGRSTAPGNLLVREAVGAGVVDALCSDYLPMSLQGAPHALASAGVLPLGRAVDLVSTAPAAALGLPSPVIEVGRPLTAALGEVRGANHRGLALWRGGRLTFSRTGMLERSR